MTSPILLTALYVACGVLAYGFVLGNDYLTHGKITHHDIIHARAIGFMGYLGLFIALCFWLANGCCYRPIFRNPHREDG